MDEPAEVELVLHHGLALIFGQWITFALHCGGPCIGDGHHLRGEVDLFNDSQSRPSQREKVPRRYGTRSGPRPVRNLVSE